MADFLGERVEVETDETYPRPVRFTWRGQVRAVAQVLQERVDIGFGEIPPGSRRWYNRRHRRYYVIKDSAGDVFELYIDYANRKKPTWWLVRREGESATGPGED